MQAEVHELVELRRHIGEYDEAYEKATSPLKLKRDALQAKITEELKKAAVETGAKRLCLCDTCGAAVPQGVWNLVSWVKALVKELGVEVGIDWHGHRDRGLDLANSLAAIEAGATRVH